MGLRENINQFLERVKELETYDDNDCDGYKKEFKKIISLSKRYLQEKRFPATVGELHYNLGKNRYKDILPYDHSRVVLSEVEGNTGSDYINANFVIGATGKATYIASQGPQPNTVIDFWRMLWQYDVHVVIMACNEYEGLKMKCKRYWPGENEDIEFDGLLVHMVEEQNFDDFTVRILQVTFEKKVRLVYHLHYTSWPDHGTPANLDQILDMIALARQYHGHSGSPIVVHCSAGCGRTGTILAIDFAWNLLKLGKLDKDFSIFELVKHFRTQRQSIVQSEDQYVFVHMAVKELFERHLHVLDDHFYENVTTIDGVCMQETSDEIYENVDNTVQEPDGLADVEETSIDGKEDNYLKIVKGSGQTQQKPPLPPPKPGRLIFKESPTKTTIEQTLARLFSDSDVDTDANKPIKLDLPSCKKTRDKAVNSSLKKTNEQQRGINNKYDEKPKVGVKPAVDEQMKNGKDTKIQARVKAEECKPSLAPKPPVIRSTSIVDQLQKNAGSEERHIVQVKNVKANYDKMELKEIGNTTPDKRMFEKTEGKDISKKQNIVLPVDPVSSDNSVTKAESCTSTSISTSSADYISTESCLQKPVLEKESLCDKMASLEEPVPNTAFDSTAERVKETNRSDEDNVFDSDDEANAPEIPKKNIYSLIFDEKADVAILFKGSDISFGRKVGKPKGPREQHSLRNLSSGKSA